MNDDILALLEVHEYFRGTSDAARRDVLEVGRVRNFAPGDVVYEPRSPSHPSASSSAGGSRRSRSMRKAASRCSA